MVRPTICGRGVTEPGVPVIGADPYSTEILTDPYPFHDELREAGPVIPAVGRTPTGST
jgi:hypothetical protein